MATDRWEQIRKLKVADFSLANWSDFEITSLFKEAIQDKTEEKKLLATRFALNELALHRWNAIDKDYKLIYETTWLEKMMFVEMSYNVNETLQLAQELKAGQTKLLADVGLIVARTGEILANQEIIIAQNGEILLVVQDIQEVSYEILGNVKDIKATVNDMRDNGIKIKQDNYKPAANFKWVWYVLGGIIILAIAKKVLKKGKKKG